MPLMRLPGVGRRTAERLVIEMRDRLQKIDAQPDPGGDRHTEGTGNPVRDAVSALVALGYGLKDARRMVGELDAQGPGQRGPDPPGPQDPPLLMIKAMHIP